MKKSEGKVNPQGESHLKRAGKKAASVEREEFTLRPKVFSTGSLGWFYGGRHWLDYEGGEVEVQVSVCCTIVGSKDGAVLPQTAPSSVDSQEGQENAVSRVFAPSTPEVPPETILEALETTFKSSEGVNAPRAAKNRK